MKPFLPFNTSSSPPRVLKLTIGRLLAIASINTIGEPSTLARFAYTLLFFSIGETTFFWVVSDRNQSSF